LTSLSKIETIIIQLITSNNPNYKLFSSTDYIFGITDLNKLSFEITTYIYLN